jgi:PLP dependent protein
MDIEQRIYAVRERITKAAERAGRKPAEITLVGVTKTAGREAVETAYRAGLHDFGENRIADAEEKFTPLPYPEGTAKLHLIGHLQSNKAKRAAKLFDFIHAVDSIKLGEVLDRHAAEAGKKLPILIQVNVSGEASKEGIEPQELPEVLTALGELPHIELSGLMTIAPLVLSAEETRPVFRSLYRLFEKSSSYVKINDKWKHLSMGMTNDFEVAIEEGATLIRVGRAIFA